MTGLMQKILGADWEKLPASLKAHYQSGPNVDSGHLDIEFPRWMTLYLRVLQVFGALLARSGKQLPTRVHKNVRANRHYWRRTMIFPDGRQVCFNSVWVAAGGTRLIDYVNPVMGLEMRAFVKGEELHYAGVRYVLNFGWFRLGLPEWLILGHTTIVERALSPNAFAMDFRLTHPCFGQVFRYSGTFVTERVDVQGRSTCGCS